MCLSWSTIARRWLKTCFVFLTPVWERVTCWVICLKWVVITMMSCFVNITRSFLSIYEFNLSTKTDHFTSDVQNSSNLYWTGRAGSRATRCPGGVRPWLLFESVRWVDQENRMTKTKNPKYSMDGIFTYSYQAIVYLYLHLPYKLTMHVGKHAVRWVFGYDRWTHHVPCWTYGILWHPKNDRQTYWLVPLTGIYWQR